MPLLACGFESHISYSHYSIVEKLHKERRFDKWVLQKQQVEKSLASDVSVNSDVTLEKSLPKKNQMITFVRLVVSTIKKKRQFLSI